MGLHWLRHTRGMDVVAFSANFGGTGSLDMLGSAAVEIDEAHDLELLEITGVEEGLPPPRAG